MHGKIWNRLRKSIFLPGSRVFEVEAGHFFRIYSHQGHRSGSQPLVQSKSWRKILTAKPGPCMGPIFQPGTGFGRVSRSFDRWHASPMTAWIGTVSWRRGFGSWRDRHRCNLHRQTAFRNGLSSLLSLESDPGFLRLEFPMNTEPYVHDIQCLHVHRIHSGHPPVFHEGKSGPFGRLHVSFPRSICFADFPPAPERLFEHSSDQAQCYPLRVEILRPQKSFIEEWVPPNPSSYNRLHQDPEGWIEVDSLQEPHRRKSFHHPISFFKWSLLEVQTFQKSLVTEPKPWTGWAWMWRKEILALLGENGAGKRPWSEPSAGWSAFFSKILVDGVDAWKNYREARSRLALVPQEIALDPFSTVYQTVRFAGDILEKRTTWILWKNQGSFTLG